MSAVKPTHTTTPPPPGLNSPDPGNSTDAPTKLAEAIDDFLGDLEKKFKGISDEILTKLDDMAERCDRLEQEMLVREASSVHSEKSASPSGSGKGEA